MLGERGGEREREGERDGIMGGRAKQDQSTSAEWALAPSCDLWPASAPKAQILLTIASCSTWITLVFKHQQLLQLATGDAADARETGKRGVRMGKSERWERREDTEGGGETREPDDGEGDRSGRREEKMF